MKMLGLALVMLGLVVAAQSRALTDEQVALALAAPKPEGSVCIGGYRGHLGPEFRVCVAGPVFRVSALAAVAKKTYRTVTVADVDAGTRAGAWSVEAMPDPPKLEPYGWKVTPLAIDAVFQAHDKKDAPVVRPTVIKLVPAEWANAFNAKFSGQGFAATFDPTVLPAGDIDLVILLNDPTRTEERHELNVDKRTQIK